MKRRAVVVVDGSGGAAGGAARKRPRFDEDVRKAEKERFLSGDIAGIMAATGGSLTLPVPRRVREKEVDFRGALNSVRDLGAQNQHKARNRKELESKKLAALGARIRWKPQTMPYRQFLGVTKARKAREAAAEAEARVSQVVTGAKFNKGKRQKTRGPPREDDDAPEPMNIRGPVMYLGK